MWFWEVIRVQKFFCTRTTLRPHVRPRNPTYDLATPRTTSQKMLHFPQFTVNDCIVDSFLYTQWIFVCACEHVWEKSVYPLSPRKLVYIQTLPTAASLAVTLPCLWLANWYVILFWTATCIGCMIQLTRLSHSFNSLSLHWNHLMSASTFPCSQFLRYELVAMVTASARCCCYSDWVRAEEGTWRRRPETERRASCGQAYLRCHHVAQATQVWVWGHDIRAPTDDGKPQEMTTPELL